jgi:hypothetical protein
LTAPSCEEALAAALRLQSTLPAADERDLQIAASQVAG